MAKNMNEWEEYLRTLTTERRTEIAKAIRTVFADDEIKKHFGWVSLESIAHGCELINKYPLAIMLRGGQ